jgi:predicted Zn-dependent protease
MLIARYDRLCSSLVQWTQTTEADVRLDNTGRTTWYNGNVANKTDVQSVMAHEVGHMIAFRHVNDDSNVMYPTIFENDASNRKLGRGDANANNTKY